MKVMKCSRCQRRYRGQGDWNATVERGVIVGVLCPDCQTPDENAEAEINAATLDYERDPSGRITGRPKETEPSEAERPRSSSTGGAPLAFYHPNARGEPAAQ